MKYLVVTGGVVSGLGKGITISSLGVLLQARGLKCGALKIDGYLNVDAGTMSPLEHGECFVLADGGEVDLDAGNYERHLGIRLTRDHSLTTGKIYSQVIAAERQGQYLGKTVQVIPHVTDAIQDWIERVAHMPVEPAADAYSSSAVSASASATSAKVGAAAAAGGAGADDDSDDDSDGDSRRAVPGTPDVFLVEVGGTVGDIESLVFLEAMRQFAVRVGHENVVFVHLSLVPVVGGEQKTKPTQHSVKELRSLGISPDILVCRSAKPLLDSTRTKLALHCQVAPEALLVIPDVPNIHHVPLVLEEQHAADIIARRMRLPVPTPGPDFGPTAAALARWREIAHVVDTATAEVHIALVGESVDWALYLSCPMLVNSARSRPAIMHLCVRHTVNSLCRQVHRPAGQLPICHQVSAGEDVFSFDSRLNASVWRFSRLCAQLLSLSSPSHAQKCSLPMPACSYAHLRLHLCTGLQHAAIAARKRLVIDWIDAAALEPATEAEDAEAFASSWAMLRAADGVLVPGESGMTMHDARCMMHNARCCTPDCQVCFVTAACYSLLAGCAPCRWIRRPWRGGQDRCSALRTREPQALPWHLPWHAVRRHRVRAPQAGPGGRKQRRVQPLCPAQAGHLHARRIDHPHGRHDAPWRTPDAAEAPPASASRIRCSCSRCF